MTCAKISVVVPVYNCKKYLHECIGSLLQQTYPYVEIILVDDGSTDSSPIICEQYALQSSQVRVIHKKNGGAAAARCTGVLYATGEYIAFVDADDFVTPDFLQTLAEPIDILAPDLIVGNFRNSHTSYVNPQYFAGGYYDERKIRSQIFPKMLSAQPHYTFGIMPSMCAKLFKRDIAHKSLSVLSREITFGEDGCFTYCALLNSRSLYISSADGYVYRYNEYSATHNFRIKLLEDPKKLKKIYSDLSQKYAWDCQSQLDAYMAYVCQYIAVMAMSAENFKSIKKQVTACLKSNFPKDFLKADSFKDCSFKQKIRYLLIKGCHWWIFKFINMWHK